MSVSWVRDNRDNTLAVMAATRGSRPLPRYRRRRQVRWALTRLGFVIYSCGCGVGLWLLLTL